MAAPRFHDLTVARVHPEAAGSVAITFAVQLLAMMVQLVAGPSAAIWVANLLMMAVLMPLLAGAVYHAWRQMLGASQATVGSEVTAPASHFEA